MGHGNYADASPEQVKAAVETTDKFHALKSAGQRPSIGRVVHYTPASPIYGPGEVWTATVARVNDTSINIGGYDAMGRPFDEQEVPQADPGVVAGTTDAVGCWAWPEYVPPRPSKGDV